MDYVKCAVPTCNLDRMHVHGKMLIMERHWCNDVYVRVIASLKQTRPSATQSLCSTPRRFPFSALPYVWDHTRSLSSHRDTELLRDLASKTPRYRSDRYGVRALASFAVLNAHAHSNKNTTCSINTQVTSPPQEYSTYCIKYLLQLSKFHLPAKFIIL